MYTTLPRYCHLALSSLATVWFQKSKCTFFAPIAPVLVQQVRMLKVLAVGFESVEVNKQKISVKSSEWRKVDRSRRTVKKCVLRAKSLPQKG